MTSHSQKLSHLPFPHFPDIPPITVAAYDTIYKNDKSQTTLKDGKYYRHHKNDMSGAWSGREIDGEVVHPDGVCSSQAMTSMKPIRADNNILTISNYHYYDLNA